MVQSRGGLPRIPSRKVVHSARRHQHSAAKGESGTTLGSDARGGAGGSILFDDPRIRRSLNMLASTDWYAILQSRGKWCKSQANWTYTTTPPSQGGGLAWVSVKDCDDSAGAGETGTAFNVYLPVQGGQDPNVVTNDTLIYYTAEDGTKFSLGTSDGWIGQLVMDAINATAPAGWAVADGTANSVLNGGSALDLRNAFPRMWNTSGELGGTGGTDGVHTHTVASSGAHTHTATTDSGTTGISVGNHTGNTASATTGISAASATTGVTVATANPSTSSDQISIGTTTLATTVPDHSHLNQGEETIDTGVETEVWAASGLGGSTAPATVGVTITPNPHGHTNAIHSHTVSHTHSVTDTGHTHSVTDTGHLHGLGTITHGVTDTGHTHTLSVPSGGAHTHTTDASASILPTFVKVSIFERLDNSS